LNQLAGATQGVQAGLTGKENSVHAGIAQEQDGLNKLAQGIGQLQGTAASMSDDLNALLKAHPELAQDPSFQQVMGKQQGLAQGLTQSSKNMPSLQGGLTQVDGGLQKVAGGLGQIADQQRQAANGVGKLQQGLTVFQDQLGQASGALNKISSGATQATSGLNQLADGTGTISDSIGQLQSGIGQMADGVGKSKDGLGQVTNGLGQVQDAQQGIVTNGSKQVAGWYLPESALKESDMQKAVDTYISPDGKIAKIDVVLSINPYSQEAMDSVEKIKDTLQQGLNGTVIQNPVLKATGVPAQNHELDGISHSDFMRTGLLIVVGIYIVLALMLRSVLAPLYLLASLLFSYTVTMGIVEFVFTKIFGNTGLSWTVSFFAFILLVALGVDYSIFLMARFKEEYRPGGVVAAMQKAMTSTGGVIISAAIIMGGTFGAMAFSGVNSMMQIGLSIVIGLFVYAVVVMGLIVPALAILFGEANWWPLGRSKVRKNTKIEPQVSSSTNL
ncbi:MAG: MMPL family transporter, partial [Tumebacillaceae bacterium]